MSARVTISALAMQLQQLRADVTNTPVAYRWLRLLVPYMNDEADETTTVYGHESGSDDVRLVAFGIKSPRGTGYDVVIAQVGEGAGDGVLNVEWLSGDELVSKYGTATDHQYRILAERVRGWLYDLTKPTE